MSKIINYVIRKPGNTAWAEIKTKAAALKELARANSLVQVGHHIYAEHADGTVTGPHDEV